MAGDQNWDDTTCTSNSKVEVPAFRKDGKPFLLELIQGPGAPHRYTLSFDKLVVGRSEEADIQIGSLEISRRHMLLNKAGNEYVCLDLNSRNGLYLNGVKIHSATLKDGDRLQLGDVVFVYHAGA